MRRASLVDLFDDLPATQDEWLVYDNGYRRWSYSYARVKRAARGFAARLREAGVEPGDRVVMWSENRPEWIVAFWGAVLARVVIVPIDAGASFTFMERVRRLVNARLVLAGDEVARGARSRGQPDTAESSVAPPADSASWWNLAELDWDDARGAQSQSAAGEGAPVAGENQLPAVSPDDLVEIIFTSGATAEPKGVLISHRNLLANVEAVEGEIAKYRRYLRLMHPLRFLNLLPLSHLFGQALSTFIPPLISGTAVFMHGHNPADVARLVRLRRVAFIVGVPMILELLRSHVARSARSAADLADRGEHWTRRWWRYRDVHRLFGPRCWGFIVGAAPLGPDLERFWSRLGFLVIQGYGLTETAPIVTLNHPLAIGRGSVGTPIAGVEIRIGAGGEILVRGENVSAGYFGAPADETARRAASGPAADRTDGWLATGDIGEIDAEGRLYIRGRKKEMIVTPDGLNVFPEEIEEALLALPGVRDAAVVGELSASGERPHAGTRARRGHRPGHDCAAGERAARRSPATARRHALARRGAPEDRGNAQAAPR